VYFLYLREVRLGGVSTSPECSGVSSPLRQGAGQSQCNVQLHQLSHAGWGFNATADIVDACDVCYLEFSGLRHAVDLRERLAG
jgi:hypothetical protein